ncbi:MAG: hypothetical protein IKR37_03150 [Paludibacteraceae bacterium]|nr:hypothetical protein [Paludibacteraceae bacterium]
MKKTKNNPVQTPQTRRQIMSTSIPQFRCKDDKGNMIFVLPFSFVSENWHRQNVCEKYFKEIIPAEKKLVNDKKTEQIKPMYQRYKEELCVKLRNSKSSLFDHAAPTLEDLDDLCTYCYAGKHDLYTGRNLCHCLSISRRFHDDRSQFTPRLEVLLGSYNVNYQDEINQAHFSFRLIATLLLCGEEGNECGYLMYSIPLKDIKEEGFGSATKTELDNIIFLKHLFYKQRLHCTIDNGEKRTSLQKWTEKYISELMPVLGIQDYKKAFNDAINFRYSMIELNNIVDENGELISMENVKQFMQTYHKQLYGILVSDEGWRNTPDEEINSLFGHNYWTSRDYNCAICLNRNAIAINQYKRQECKDNRADATKWMSHYSEKGNEKNTLAFYEEYISLNPCIPGVSTLTFDAYLRVICKEMRIDIAKKRTEGDKEALEKRYTYLANTLQTYSMQLDVIQSLEDMICSQFGLQATLNNLRDRYTREANNMQNKKVKILTVVTAFISLCSFVISVLALHTPNHSEDIFAGYQSATYYFFFAALIISLAIFLAMLYQLIKLLFFDK